MAETPATPGNPFREGAEQSVDAQKIALTKMLAEQGAVGSQILSNRAQDAAALSAASGQQANPLYQTFERDAAQARQFQQSEAARIAAANQAYLDQVKSALPIHARDTDAYYEALRKEYEDRQRQREAEERYRQQQLAAQRRASSSSNALVKALEARAVDRELAAQDFADLHAGQKTPSLAKMAGVAGGPRSIIDAAKALGFDPKAAEKRWVKGDPKSQFYQQDQALMSAIKQGMDLAIANDLPWAQVVADGRELAKSLGLNYEANVQPWLAVYSPLWGLKDSEWATPVPRGRTR